MRVTFRYVVHRGKSTAVSDHRAIPVSGSLRLDLAPGLRYHQWVFDAFDEGAGRVRTFALQYVRGWRPVIEQTEGAASGG